MLLTLEWDFSCKMDTQISAADWVEYKKFQKDQEIKSNRPFVGGGYGSTKSVGQMFVESDVYKNFLAKGGATSESFKIERKDLVKSRDVNGNLIGNVPSIIAPAESGFTMRDLLSVGNTTNSAVDYLEEITYSK